jgi:hypothetical protein
MTMSWTPVPDSMHRIAETGAIVLRDFPLPPDRMLDEPAPEHGTQRHRLREARNVWIALAAGELPSRADLFNAPSLFVRNVVEEDGFLFFEGRVFDHPLISEGHLCRTSLVVGFEGDRMGWARTVSRWYRLRQVTGKH